jgi:hypothetical protein
MKYLLRPIGLLGIVVLAPALASVADIPQKVRPLSVGDEAPIFGARTTQGVLRTSKPDGYKKTCISSSPNCARAVLKLCS